MSENIKFFEENGQHGWKRISPEGSTEKVSALFASLELAQADAQTDIGGEHAPEASEPSAPEAEVVADAPAEEAVEEAPAAEEVAEVLDPEVPASEEEAAE